MLTLKSADPLDRRARGLWDVPGYLESLDRPGYLESCVLVLDLGPGFLGPGILDLGPGSRGLKL